MTYGDFFRALTPYNYGEIKSNAQYLEKFKDRVGKVLHLADADADGVISFTEFFFFMTVLQLPPEIVHKDFHAHEGHKMTKEEFSKCMTRHRRNTKFGANQKDSGSLGHMDSRHVKASNEDFLDTNKKITEKIFDGKTTISEKEYNQLRAEIRQ